MEKAVYFEPGYDKRSTDPAKNYDIRGMSIRFVLKGERGAVQFLLFTDWYPKEVQEERFFRQRWDKKARPYFFELQPIAVDLGYHAREPQYEGQEMMTESCELLGGPCYYDGSGLAADPIRDRLLTEGDKAVWEALEQRYIDQFGALE
jgi:hypothetical protein